MTTYARENLSRLMAAGDWSQQRLAEATGVDARTIRKILEEGHHARAGTFHRLARGLGVVVDEFFVDPAQLLYRRFDRRANPAVAEVVEAHPSLFEGWTEADFDELHSRVGTGGALTVEGALAAVAAMNRKRRLHEQLDVVLESSHAELTADILGALYDNAVLAPRPNP
jgi:transcriptional regulator with XRE-family HTH domain